MKNGNKYKMRLLLFFTILFLFSETTPLTSQGLFSQINILKNPYLNNCTVMSVSPCINNSPGNMGYLKPSVTDFNAPEDAYFPVLIVFVQFANDPGPEVPWWPKGNAPEYLNQMLANHKKYPPGGNWWDVYSEDNEVLSDYWLEQSRGHLHVIGNAVSVVLDHDYHYYQEQLGYKRVNDDIYLKLKAMGTLNWTKYDMWSTIEYPDYLTIEYGPDGYVDMLYMVYRSRPPGIDLPAGGAAALGESRTQGENYLIDNVNHIYINGLYYYHGSGLILSPGFGGDETDTSSYVFNAPLDKMGTASFSEHEYGHYLLGAGHTNYGKMTGNYGVDESLSPWEKVTMRYIVPKEVNYDIHSYEIGDFSSRNSNDTGEVLRVLIGDDPRYEYFLISNRTKISKYDKIMWGDTAHGNPYREIYPNYGKGVYIYHVSNWLVDQECADGLYSWSQKGFQHPDWSDNQNVEYYSRDSVSYNNDRSLLGSFLCTDGKSVFTWFNIGKKHSCINCDGTDKVYSNSEEVWTSREFQGDRWDAWNIGYNEMFSPYSSPSTKGWYNDNTGIFIWLYKADTSASVVYFKIYRAGYGGMTEDSILAVTPPSRPMGLLSGITDCENNYQYPMISWLHNMEPDMINCTVPVSDKKFYNIYKAISKDMQVAPYKYQYLETVNIDKDSVSKFIDYSQPIQCGGNSAVEAIRYVVTAVDNRGWESVKSDFASVIVKDNDVILDNFNHIKPFVYELKQNYPNPFNPETKINFSLARSGHVKITVYNLLGEQVSILVNEFRQEGEYNVKFNGSGLASGIYFCRIETSGFTKTRKMVLIR